MEKVKKEINKIKNNLELYKKGKKIEKSLLERDIDSLKQKRKKLLERAIRSVEKQTYKNIEIVVVAEGSSATEARNIGIDRANGKFIAFLDDDDEWMPEKTEKQIQVMNKHPECPLVICYSHDMRFNQDRINKPPEIIAHKMIIKSFNLSSTSTYDISYSCFFK